VLSIVLRSISQGLDQFVLVVSVVSAAFAGFGASVGAVRVVFAGFGVITGVAFVVFTGFVAIGVAAGFFTVAAGAAAALDAEGGISGAVSASDDFF
jgi:hypothetical protein